MLDRRTFLTSSVAAVGAAALCSKAPAEPSLANATSVGGYHYQLLPFKNGSRLLFQGNSIVAVGFHVICGVLMMCLSGCTLGGPNTADPQKLGAFIEAIDQNYSDHDSGIASGELNRVLVSMETREQELVEGYLAAPEIPDDIKVHLESWRDGLNVVLPIHREWAEKGGSWDEAAQSEKTMVKAALMQTTEAETALRIIAER